MKGYPAQTATFDRKTDARIWAQQTEMSIREGKHFKFLQANQDIKQLEDMFKVIGDEFLSARDYYIESIKTINNPRLNKEEKNKEVSKTKGKGMSM